MISEDERGDTATEEYFMGFVKTRRLAAMARSFDL